MHNPHIQSESPTHSASSAHIVVWEFQKYEAQPSHSEDSQEMGADTPQHSNLYTAQVLHTYVPYMYASRNITAFMYRRSLIEHSMDLTLENR